MHSTDPMDAAPAGCHKMVFCGENYMMTNDGGTHNGDCHDATGIKELHCDGDGGMDHHGDHDGHDGHDDHDECSEQSMDCETCCVDHADVDCDHCGHDHDAGIHEETRPEMDTNDM